eukprot:3118444-Pleurochrysis_carterae.AAC.1
MSTPASAAGWGACALNCGERIGSEEHFALIKASSMWDRGRGHSKEQLRPTDMYGPYSWHRAFRGSTDDLHFAKIFEPGPADPLHSLVLHCFRESSRDVVASVKTGTPVVGRATGGS